MSVTQFTAQNTINVGHHDELFWRKAGKAQDGSATSNEAGESIHLVSVVGGIGIRNAAIRACFGTIAKRPRIEGRFSFYAFRGLWPWHAYATSYAFDFSCAMEFVVHV